MYPIAVGILAVVFLLIVMRRIGHVRLPIWAVMTAGAVLALVTGSITPEAAVAAVNVDVIVFLFGMFVLGVAMERLGRLHTASVAAFAIASSRHQVMVWLLFLMTGASAFLMNDTGGILGPPVVL